MLADDVMLKTSISKKAKVNGVGSVFATGCFLLKQYYIYSCTQFSCVQFKWTISMLSSKLCAIHLRLPYE